MRKEQMLMTAFLLSTVAGLRAQTVDEHKDAERALRQDNAAFVFTESQLGEDDDQTPDIILVGSNTNYYTSNVGYRWSPVRFKYRAYDSRYSDIYMNGVKVNNGESGRFNYSTIGGMNDAMRNIDACSPFESNTFSMAGIGGSNNYDLRAASFSTGHKFTISGANRNYSTRVMYGYGTGLSSKGWAFYGTVGYRWANTKTSNIEGNFYNSLSYFLSTQKVFNDKHSLSLSTWGNPTERAQQGASTDEAYWLANNRLYNPYWGYQGDKKRNSRIVNNFEPSALLTWDYVINDKMRLTTTAFTKYAMYSSTKLYYNGNKPDPDYWRNMPTAQYNPWTGEGDVDAWLNNYNYWVTSQRNRQINWDRLYYANMQQNKIGKDAIYWIEKRHNNHLATNLASTFEWSNTRTSKFTAGLQLGSNKGMHYLTMSDLLGGQYYHNINSYLVGERSSNDPAIQYDLRNPNARVKEGDRFRYDYDLISQFANIWIGYAKNKGVSHNYITAKLGGSQMWRKGNMQNGLAKDYSYGKSGVASFLDGGFKMGSNLNLGYGNAMAIGVGYETRAPQTSVAFVSPEVNNNFVNNLRNEKIFTAELGYSLNNKWIQLNLNGYFTHTYDGTEWTCFYFDDQSSFTYMSLTDITKNFYGAELGAKFKITSNLDVNFIGTYSEAQYQGDGNAVWMLSNTGQTGNESVGTDGMRESGTPLAAVSLGANYRLNGWYFSLIGNYYDRIYLGYSAYQRLASVAGTNNDGSPKYIAQAKGNGGFMLDASIGRSFRIAGHPLNVNLMLTNLTNNTNITTGGYEQSRKNRTSGYSFSRNPKKYYAQGFNFMLNLNYRF